MHVAHTKNGNLTQYSQQVSMNLVKMCMLSSKQDINKQNYLLFMKNAAILAMLFNYFKLSESLAAQCSTSVAQESRSADKSGVI